MLSFDDIFWILGGKAKAGGIEPLRPLFGRIRKAYLIGEAAQDFAATLGTAPSLTNIAGRWTSRSRRRPRDAQASDAAEPVVLLSPACASYDQFANFEKRGDAFREYVAGLLADDAAQGALF